MTVCGSLNIFPLEIILVKANELIIKWGGAVVVGMFDMLCWNHSCNDPWTVY